MPRSARFFVALLLAIDVPWHALSAATMVTCSLPSHHDIASAHDEAAAQMHHGHGAKAATAKAKCGAAASCCAASAVPSKPTRFMGVTDTQTVDPVRVGSIAPFLTTPLERPLRTNCG